MNKYVAEKLLKKYNQGSCNEEEKAIIESWHLKELGSKNLKLGTDELEEVYKSIWSAIKKNIEGKEKVPFKRFLNFYTAAAVILITLSAGLIFFIQKSKHPSVADLLVKTGKDFIPGGNKATLTLADGSKISLTDAANGKLVQQSGITITKTKDGQLVYNISRTNSQKTLAVNGVKQVVNYNTIETPKGGQYQVNLPDGSSVWLNAASSLKYPTVFNNEERKVELTGEAYFEVAKTHKPFVVKTAQQEVEVLGTHFNISSYADEAVTKTTLLEGSVRVVSASRHPELVSGPRNKKENSYGSNSKAGILKQVQDDVVLKPGQQSQVSASQAGPLVVTADIESEMAWKNGFFVFKDESIESVMRKLSRWYDIEINFEGKPSALSFVGVVSRSKNISAVLKIMEEAGNVSFKVEGRKITVMN